MRDHLESYRENLKKDALEGCIDYSMQVKTANPDRWPTVFDYLKYTLDAARYHAEADDPASYKLWLPKHQEAMILLFERMVDETLFGADLANLEITHALIKEKGWNWFKFGQKAVDHHLVLDDGSPLTVTVIPRYSTRWQVVGTTNVIFDSDEIQSTMAIQDLSLVRQIAARKRELGEKFLGLHLINHVPTPIFRPVDQVNDTRVWDWTLPLWRHV